MGSEMCIRDSTSTPEGFEHAVVNVPEVADLVRLALRMEYAEARWS